MFFSNKNSNSVQNDYENNIVETKLIQQEKRQQ